MKPIDSNERAISLAKAKIRDQTYGLEDLREKSVKQISVVETRRKSLAREEAKLEELTSEVAMRDHSNKRLTELIAELGKPRKAFPDLDDEAFKKRQTDLRWEIGDYVGRYAFVHDPMMQGGF